VLSGLGVVIMLVVESNLRLSMRNGLTFFPSSVERLFLHEMPIFAPSSRVLLGKLDDAAYAAASRLNDYFYGRYSKLIRLPLLFSAVVNRAKTIREVFEIAIGFRQRKDVRRFREWCGELDLALRDGQEAVAVKMIAQAERAIRFSAEPELSGRNAGVQLSFPPAITFDVPDSMFPGRRNSLVFLRTLAKEAVGPLPTLCKVAALFGYKLPTA
jgi:hypothetical protein